MCGESTELFVFYVVNVGPCGCFKGNSEQVFVYARVILNLRSWWFEFSYTVNKIKLERMRSKSLHQNIFLSDQSLTNTESFLRLCRNYSWSVIKFCLNCTWFQFYYELFGCMWTYLLYFPQFHRLPTPKGSTNALTCVKYCCNSLFHNHRCRYPVRMHVYTICMFPPIWIFKSGASIHEIFISKL